MRVISSTIALRSLVAETGLSPWVTEADVRVMTLGLGKLTNLLNKGECVAKIAKSKGALDAMGIIAQFPTQGKWLEALSFIMRELRDASATVRACFLGERLSHVSAL